jgi:adenylate cyclase
MKYWVLDRLFNKPSKPRQMEYLAVDKCFNIIDLSEGVQRFADFSREVKLGEDVRDRFPELIGLEEKLIALLQGKEEFFELKGVGRFDDASNPLYINMYVVEDEDEISCEKNLIIFLEDVTETIVKQHLWIQQTREDSLLLSSLEALKDYFSKIVEFVPNALLVTNAAGYIKTVNRATQQVFGYSEIELIGQPISMLEVEEKKIFNTLGLQNYCRPITKSQLFTCQHKNGRKVFVEFWCSAIPMEIKDLYYFVFLGREVTNASHHRNN